MLINSDRYSNRYRNGYENDYENAKEKKKGERKTANITILERWIPKLKTLNQKDFCTLINAIISGSDKPRISAKNQFIADEIYKDIKNAKEANERLKKHRLKLNDCANNERFRNGFRNSYGNAKEKKEAPLPSSPPCSPLSSPSSSPPYPLTITPYNPPTKPPHDPTPQEKRENTPGGDPPLPDRQGESYNADARAGNSLQEKTQSQYSPCFEELWNTYPKKSGKKPAYESYKRAKKDGVTDEEIRAGIERYKDYIKAKRLTERYILDGSTYFYQRRWEDVYELPPDSGDDYGGDAFSRLLNAELDKIQNRFGGTVR